MEPLLPRVVDGYLDDLVTAQLYDPVVMEMERRASETGFPIVGRAAGRYLELTTRMAGARRVVELGSGYGYSSFWFARGVGEDGEVIGIDRDAENSRLAESYLRRTGVWDRCETRTGDALREFASLEGPVDLVFCDVDKDGYPAVWDAVADRLDVGGLFVCDNALWYGRVAGLAPDDQDAEVAAAQAAVAPAVIAMTREVVNDPRYLSSIVPIHDGLLVAQRIA
jgi:caffeoyl-CoA O-methyltransferase